MKQLLFLLLILAGFAPLTAQTDIVAGGGECKVTGDPDLHPTLGDADLNNCWLAVDVTNGEKYWYNPFGAPGDRWDIIPPPKDDQNLTLTGTTLAIENGNSIDLNSLTSSMSINNLTGNPIATHFSGSGGFAVINETITDLTFDGVNLSYIREDDLELEIDLSILNTDDQNLTLTGTTLAIEDGNSVDLTALNTDDQNLTLTGTTLSIEDGNSVDLSTLQDGTGTDDQNLTLTGTTLTIEDGNSVDLATLDTDDQTLSLSGTELTISQGNTVDLGALSGVDTDDQELTLTGTTLSIEDGNSVDLSALQDGTGTDDQNLTLTGTTLAIEDGNSVDLATLDTDDQDLTLTGTTLSIEDGNSVDLSVLQDGTGTDDQNLTLTGNTLSIEDGNSVDLAALDTDDQGVDAFSLTGTTLTLEIEDDGQAPHTVDLSALQDGIGTDDQNLTLTGGTLSIEDGNSVDLSGLADGIGTDDQNLTLTGTTLSIESGNSVDLSAVQDGTGTDDQKVIQFSLTGTNLTLEIEDDASSPNTVDLSSLQDGTGTDDQNLTLTGTTLSIEDGNSVDLSSVGGGGSFGAVTVNVGGITTYTHTGESYLFIEASMNSVNNTLAIDESQPNGSIIEVWFTRSAGNIEFTGTNIRVGNDISLSGLDANAGQTIRFVKIRGVWVAVYKGQY